MRLGVLVPGLIVALSPALADAHNCKCRNRGTMFELGQTSCLKVDGASYLALRDEAQCFVLDQDRGWLPGDRADTAAVDTR